MRFRALLVVPLAALAAACGSSSNNSGPAAASTRTTISGVPAGVSTRKLSGLGTILVSESGRTLYTFSPEKGGKIACTGSCASLWPLLTTTESKPSTSSALVHPNLLSSVADPTGGKVITYAGWPLHTYAGDTQAGTASGQGIDGKWYVISPSGQVVTRSASSSSSSSSSGGGANPY